MEKFKDFNEGIEQKKELAEMQQNKGKTEIKLSKAELQSGSSRVNWAEGLIEQLPKNHDGRNSWLMNYGKRKIALDIRANDNGKRKDEGYSPRKLIWNEETECLCSAT